MKKQRCFLSRPSGWLRVFLGSLLVAGMSMASVAHPMPNSVVLLNVHTDRIEAEVQIPLSELQAAWGHAVNDSSAGLVVRLGPQLRDYLARHIHLQSIDGRSWGVSVGVLAMQQTRNPINGIYRELRAQVRFIPPVGSTARRFIFYYDAVLHQVVTHKILVSVRQDWARGQIADENPVQVGVIELDIVNNRILPLSIDLETGSIWTGFRAMIKLGMRHIAEGTDHLLFLLVLLLPAPLLVRGHTVGPPRPQWYVGRVGWGQFGGIRYSLIRLLQIVTAFTVGHSLTLLLGALGWVRLPSQPVELLTAVSILVSAVHAVRPLFPGREAWVAAGFGLVHGLAFASTLANLRLDAGPMAVSILGFNLGIEFMQVGIIALVIPWLILLSQTSLALYRIVRLGGAVLAGAAALAWVAERATGRSNVGTAFVGQLANWSPWLLAGLAIIAVVSWLRGRAQSVA